MARLFYIGPIFRYERPQAGRYREAHQLGVEALGSDSPLLDVEVIDLCTAFLAALGLSDLDLGINSMGCRQCRPAYREALVKSLEANREQLCDLCKRRLEQNPLRILDCKNAECKALRKQAPAITGFLCQSCREHFEQVQAGLRLLGRPFRVDPTMVRGLDYYTRTVFEINSSRLGAQAQVCGGGRYDNLVEELGGPPTPASGFACGLERIAMLLGGSDDAQKAGPLVYVAYTGDDLRGDAFALASQLRREGISAQMDYDASSLRAQMRSANRAGAAWAVIIGEQEKEQGNVILRNMSIGEQETVGLDEALRRLRQEVSAARTVEGSNERSR